MAARLNPKNDERARSAIQTTQLCKRLNAFALGEKDPCYPQKELVMTSDQVRAALGLLKKTIPDLAVTAHTGPDGGPVLVITGVERSDSSNSNEIGFGSNDSDNATIKD
jgi:hypothetical protein